MDQAAENNRQELSITSLYHDLIRAWNECSAQNIALLFSEKGNMIGFDGSQVNGRSAIELELTRIFNNHKTAPFITKVQEVRFLSSHTALLRAIVGMVGKGKTDINPDLNAIQTMIATFSDKNWQIELFQNTPAQFHGRPELVEAMSKELRELL